MRKIASTHPVTGCNFRLDNAPVSPKWFVVYTIRRHEKRLAKRFSQREIEHYLPLYRSERRWRDGSRVTLDLPLFPSYIFVRINESDCVRVLNVPGAVAVVGGTGREPARLPDATIDALRSGLQRGEIEPHPLLTVGQRARIRSGAFAGMEGIVTRKKNRFRVVLTLEQMMQSLAVEVDEGDLMPSGPAETGPVRPAILASATANRQLGEGGFPYWNHTGIVVPEHLSNAGHFGVFPKL